MKVKGKSLSCVRLLATPWTAVFQAPPSMGFSRQEYWSGVPLPSPLLYTTAYKWSKGDCKVYFICFAFLRNHCPLLLDIQCLENHCFIYLPTFFDGGVGCISKYGSCYSILAKSGSFCHLFKIFNCCVFSFSINIHFPTLFFKLALCILFLKEGPPYSGSWGKPLGVEFCLHHWLPLWPWQACVLEFLHL